jgi:polar amino acid transport system substrate-binding protein
VKEKVITVEYAKGIESNINKFILGRVDCFAVGEPNFFWVLKKMAENPVHSELKNFKFTKVFSISREFGYIGYSKAFTAGYKQDFIRKMDAALQTLKKTGKIEEIRRKYLE